MGGENISGNHTEAVRKQVLLQLQSLTVIDNYYTERIDIDYWETEDEIWGAIEELRGLGDA